MNKRQHNCCLLLLLLLYVATIDASAKNITFCLYCQNEECSGSHPHCMEYELGKCSEFLNLCDEQNPHANVSISFTENEDQTYTYRTYSEQYPTCYKTRILWNFTTACGKCDTVTNAMIDCSSTSSPSSFDIAYVLAAVIIGVLAVFVVLLIVLFFYVKKRKSVKYTRHYFKEEQTGLLKEFNKQQQFSSQASQDNNLYMGKYLYSAKFLQEYGVPWAMIEVDHSSTEFEEVSNWFDEDLHQKTPMYFLERQEQHLPPISFEVTRAFKIINEKKQQELERIQERFKKDGIPLEEMQLTRAYHGVLPNNLELLCKQSLSRSKATTQSKSQDEAWRGNAPDGIYVTKFPEFTLHESNNGKFLSVGDRVKIVMFYVLLGKTYHVTRPGTSIPKEWCLLDDAQCLPAYVVEVEAK